MADRSAHGSFWSGSICEFRRTDPAELAHALAYQQAHRFASVEPQQLRSWNRRIAILRASLPRLPHAPDARLLLEFPLLRLGRRIDAILVTAFLIAVFEFKDKDSFETADLLQAEDYALDLRDFHAGSRAMPIVPILVAAHARNIEQSWPLILPGSVANVLRATEASLPETLNHLLRTAPRQPLMRPIEWESSPYRPIPTIIDAARTLYGGHGVADIASAAAGSHNLTLTTETILSAIAEAQATPAHVIIFVTGMPGAGKTLCGLNVAFSPQATSATFLTGNPTLVHVFREALARDAARGERGRLRLARHRTKTAIQALPKFRDHYVGRSLDIPAEHVVVIDEAQRSWSSQHAIRKTRDRPIQLTMSEPAHLLDIMARRTDWSAIVCLVGGGQEIHTGEGGLAEWGNALRERPSWRVHAAPDLLDVTDPRQSLGDLPNLSTNPGLHLAVPVRSIRNPAAASWVDRLLGGDDAAARTIASAGDLPFRLTRDLAQARHHLRASARALRRAGLLASSGAARLRANGLGVELPHMDEAAVARWFLDRWPDVRASDALEVVATEFSAQGLELDYVGLCWGGDLVTAPDGWQTRRFSGTQWQRIRGPEAIANQINTYRVLLTRARYETIIWVPPGDPADATRAPAEFDAIASRLLACGVAQLSQSMIVSR